MENIVTNITTQNEWIKVAELISGATYQVKFTPSEISSVGLHIHDSENKHLFTLGTAGAAMIGGLEYKYKFRSPSDGWLTMSVNAGIINDISVEVVA